MDQITEFVSNNLFLFVALFAVLVMLIKAEYEHQTSKAVQLSPSQATRLMNNHEDALVLDIRSKDEYAKGHIRQARNIPLAELKEQLDKLADYRDKPVIIYCNSGNTSSKAGRLLQSAGFTTIHNLAGGVAGWKEANLPLTKK
ncbi:MAG TPA: rhodanese-like domain-containing protein [Thiotrichales bacterium]|nr:rhodanese-like domain-containing protein [Thiotrichales bacterium]